MGEKIEEEVSVSLVYNEKTKQSVPKFIKWRGRVYQISQIGLHHLSRVGKILLHHFSVSDGNAFFRLTFNTESLHWKLEEILDTSSG